LKEFWNKWKGKIVPVAMLIAVVYLIWLAFGRMLPGLIPLLQEGNEEAIEQYLASQSGARGIISVLLLSMIQVVSVVLPGMAIQVAAGVIYGWWKAFLLCYTGFVLANVAVFWFDRSMGGEGGAIRVKGWAASFLKRLLDLDPVYMVGIACLIPAIPNGIIPHIAARSKATLKQFTIGVAGCCWIQILTSCLAGSFIIRGEWLFTILCIGAQVLLIAFIVWRRETVLWLLEDLRIFRNRIRFRLTGQAIGEMISQKERLLQGPVQQTGLREEPGPEPVPRTEDMEEEHAGENGEEGQQQREHREVPGGEPEGADRPAAV
jgi:uncharacterized membrane protein YdjX (TVP38/TMEM64 family)